jgi:hypothetical protein
VVTFCVDSAYCAVELVLALRAGFTLSVPHNEGMWKTPARVAADALRPASEMDGAEVAAIRRAAGLTSGFG